MNYLRFKSAVRFSVFRMLLILLAASLSAAPLFADDDIEVQGPIQSIGQDSLVVTGITFWVDANTEVEGPNGPISFSSLQVGQFVEVEADLQNNGTYLATEIELDDDIEVEGPIQALSSDSITVRGLRFLVDANTEIRDEDDDPISFSDLNIGDRVEVHGVVLANGSYLATRIELEDDEHEVEVEGLIQALGVDNLTVNGMVFFVDSTTEIRGDHGAHLTFADLQVGDDVEVRARLRADSTYLAVRIKVEDEDEYEVEVDGYITSLGVDSLVVAGLTFWVNSATEVRGLNGEHLTFADLQLNDFVEVEGYRQPDNSLLATRIRLRNSHQGEVEITAPIDTLFNDSLVVGGVLFWTDQNTEIEDDDHNPILFSDLQIGMIVEVRGLRQADSSLYAVRIEVEDFFQDEVEVTGPIDSLGMDYLFIASLRFEVDANTTVLDEQNQPIAFSDLTIGLRVEVRAYRQPDSSLLAERIEVEDSNQNEVELHGAIDSLGTGSVIVLGMEFLVDANTLILDHANNPISFSDLTVGLFVEVKARIQTNGELLATRIKVEDDPNFSQITGLVLAITGSEIVVAQPSYQLLVNTVALDENFRPIPLSEIAVGQEVTLWADAGGNQPAALQIKRNTPQNVTGIDDSGTTNALPVDFTLGQNYPNPFNPSTTIPVSLSSGKFHQVELHIYNVLGQRVRTLFQGVLDGGAYRFNWDGRSDQGYPVVSGVYLYQVRIDKQFTISKRMILLK